MREGGVEGRVSMREGGVEGRVSMREGGRKERTDPSTSTHTHWRAFTMDTGVSRG